LVLLKATLTGARAGSTNASACSANAFRGPNASRVRVKRDHVDPLAAMFRALITATAGNATAAVNVQAQ
jgi:hypothetical protein